MLFNKRYKVYIDLVVDGTDDNWIQFYPELGEFKRSPFSDEMFTRQSWGKMEIKNMPKEYADADLLGNDTTPYELYDLIKDLDIDQEIRVKAVMSNDIIDPDTFNTIIGYFGTNDCEFDDDKKIIVVTPAIYDQYTNVVENWETKIDIFPKEQVTNAVFGNGDISSAFSTSHNVPVLQLGSTISESQTPLDTDAGGVSGSVLNNLSKNYTANFTVNISGESTVTGSITFNIIVYNADDSVSSNNLLRTISSSGSISETYTLTVSLTQGQYVRFQCVIDNSSFTYSGIGLSIKLTSVPVVTNDLTINLLDSYLNTYEIWTEVEAGRNEGVKKDDYDSDIGLLAAYFDGDGIPKSTLLTDNAYAPYSIRKQTQPIIRMNGTYSSLTIERLYLSDIKDRLADEYFELSKVTVYDFVYRPNWFSKKKVRTWCTASFSRFEQWVTDGETPVGENWNDTGFTQSGKRLYVKLPFDGATSTWNLESPTGSGETDGFQYDHSQTTSLVYPSSSNSLVVDSRPLYDIIKDVYTNTHSSLATKDVESVFFWNDTDPLITVDAGINYITNKSNYLNNIDCVHTYSFQSANQNSDDAVLEVSLKDLLNDLKYMFGNQIFWWVESDGTLRIEHLKYIDLTKSTLDITREATDPTIYNSNIKLLSEISSWSYDKSKMYSLIEYNMINAGYQDFTENKITFNKIVSNKRNEDIKLNVTTSIISTDVRFCVENPTELENGMILVNHDGLHTMINAIVPISGVLFDNGNLALSNILKNFKYEGVFLEGYINGGFTQFDITSRTKDGKDFILKGIFEYDYFKTKLGVGRIESLTHNLDQEITKVTLRYRFGSDAETDVFILMVSKVGDFTGATDIQFNFG